MGMIMVRAEAATLAPPAKVFQPLYDGPSWSRWSLFTKFRLEHKGMADRLGVGAIRVMSTRISKVREQIIDAEPGIRFSYRLLSGLPLKNYRADVELAPVAEGTLVAWTSRFQPVYWGTGWFWRLVIAFIVRDTLKRLVAAAERAITPRAAGQPQYDCAL